jgi:hypothetical protein
MTLADKLRGIARELRQIEYEGTSGADNEACDLVAIADYVEGRVVSRVIMVDKSVHIDTTLGYDSLITGSDADDLQRCIDKRDGRKLP